MSACIGWLLKQQKHCPRRGAVAYFTVIYLQFIITWLGEGDICKKNSERPACSLLYQGVWLKNVMKQERIT